MLENHNQICLEKLSQKIGIPIRHGWKKELARKLHQKKQSVISTWIGRGFPKEFDSILENAGIDSALWREILEKVHEIPERMPAPAPIVPTPPSTTAYDLLFKALMDRIDRQGAILQATQASLTALQKQLTDITADLGQEIGEIKNKMIDTARSGDIHRLDPTSHYRN